MRVIGLYIYIYIWE